MNSDQKYCLGQIQIPESDRSIFRSLNLTLAELHFAVKKRSEHYPSKVPFTPEFCALSLAGEVGELCNFLKKQARDGKDYSKEIAKELADIQIYLSLLSSTLNIDLGRATIEKFNEVSDRIGSEVKL